MRDIVGKVLRTVNEGRVTLMHSHPCLTEVKYQYF